MYHPTTRVLTVLELLQAHPQLTGRELATRLEVSQRTVRHYVTMLQDMGVPIEGLRGRSGAYRLRPGYKLPPLLFTNDEAVALTLGLISAQRFGLMIAAPSVAGALAKVERVLPEQARAQVQAIHDTLVIDTDSPYTPPSAAAITTLSLAAQQKHSVQLHYRAWNKQETERRFDPYGVVYHMGRWFVIGYCHLRTEQRVFRLDRVVAVETCGTPFERPNGIDLLAAVIDSLARTPGRWQIEVLLHTTREKLMIPSSMGWLEDVDGGVLFRCAVQDLRWFAYWLVGLDCQVTIFQPAELHDQLRGMADHIQQMADRSQRHA